MQNLEGNLNAAALTPCQINGRILEVVRSKLQTGPIIYLYYHCVKCVQIRSFLWSAFLRIRTE